MGIFFANWKMFRDKLVLFEKNLMVMGNEATNYKEILHAQFNILVMLHVSIGKRICFC